MKLLLAPLLTLALVAGAAWYAYGMLRDEADRGTVGAERFAEVRTGMTRARVEDLLGGRPGFRRDEGLSGWALRTVSDLGEPAGQACAYYVDAGRARVFRVCYGPRGRVASRTVVARP